MSPSAAFAVLMTAACMLACHVGFGALDTRLLTATDWNVHHVTLAGSLPLSIAGNTSIQPPSESSTVLLHVFITAIHLHGSTTVKGLLFAESISKYSLSQWGHASQPKSVVAWGFPVNLRDLASGTVVPILVGRELWEGLSGPNGGLKPAAMHYPVPFMASLPSHQDAPACVQVMVRDWIRTAEVCFSATPTPLQRFLARQEQQQQAGGWAAWTVLPPFRDPSKTAAYIATLVHYIIYHTQVGFSGTVQYASPLLAVQLLQDKAVLRLVREGRLLLMQWDRFSLYQEVLPGQQYYPVPEQIVVTNHALLAFGAFNRTVLMAADIDEFFVPRSPRVTVQDLLRDDSCVNQGAASRPWGAIALRRINFCSSVSQLDPEQMVNQAVPEQMVNTVVPERKHAYTTAEQQGAAAADSSVWKDAFKTLECSPVYTYRTCVAERPDGGKPLLRPAGGVISWHVHTGEVDRDHTLTYAKEACAFVLHAVNLWQHRLSCRGEVSLKPGAQPWAWDPLHRTQLQDYVHRCLPEDASSRYRMDGMGIR